MNKVIKQKWVKALLSGKYEQCNSALYDGRAYCCLGVLRKVANTGGGTAGWLTHDEIAHVGLIDIEQCALGDLNDAGVPFEMIAGLIQEAL